MKLRSQQKLKIPQQFKHLRPKLGTKNSTKRARPHQIGACGSPPSSKPKSPHEFESGGTTTRTSCPHAPPPSPSWNGLRPDHLSPLNATTTTTNAAGKEDQPPDAAGRRWGERERERDLESERERTKKIGGGRKLLQQRPYLTLEGRNNNSSSSSDDVPPLPAAAPHSPPSPSSSSRCSPEPGRSGEGLPSPPLPQARRWGR